MNALCTIGYEGASIGDFIRTLNTAGVTTLLDVREIAISRKKGFSKTALKRALEDAGIAYQHEPKLGSPKAARKQLKNNKDYNAFFHSYCNHLSTQATLLNALSINLAGKVALMCFEKDHTTCHRSKVAESIGEITGLTPVHLEVHHGRDPKQRTHTYSCESISTTKPAL